MTNRFLREIDEVGNRSLTKQWVMSKWRPPETQVKINFDAAYDCNQLRSASGLVARNGEGKVLASKSILCTEVAFLFATEAHACLHAVQMGLAMRVGKIEVEGDALTIIKKCQSATIDKSIIVVYIRDIQHSDSFQSIQFKHVSRSASKTTYRIVEESLRRKE